jgi:alkylated DNA nucleotide flippase Atl1
LVDRVRPIDRLEVLFEELAELTAQRNAIDARIVDIAAEIDVANLCGMTGARSVSALIAWKTGTTKRNADTVVAIAARRDEFPRCVEGLREGRFSLDQVGVIAEHPADGSDEHYALLAQSATVNQLRTAVKLAPQPTPDPKPAPGASITKTTDGEYTTWKIRLAQLDAATFDAALASHQDALVAAWKRDHAEDTSDEKPSFPTAVDGFMSLVEAGWDTDVARRPHGQRTTVVMHVDVETRVAALHLGPALSADDRRFLTCDATCEVWFERAGQVIGHGRSARTVGRRLRRALEHRDRTCVVPGCGATRGLHAHHLQHWEDGGPTELPNLVLLCPFHHRAHHKGHITLTGPAERLIVTDAQGQELKPGSLARPPTGPPPKVKPYKSSTGERADWWWYNPFQPPAASTN